MSDKMNYEKAAEFLGVPIGTLYSYVSLEKIPHHRYGPRLVRFSKQELEQWMNDRKVDAKQESEAR